MKLSNTTKQPITIEYLGYEATLWPTESFGYTVNFPAAMLAATQGDLDKYILFLEYVQFFLHNLNDI